MAAVTILMRDGTKREFPDEERPGGSYQTCVSILNGVVIVKDVWGTQTAFPLDLIAEIKEVPRVQTRW